MKYELDERPDGQIGLFVDNEDRDACPSNIGTEELDDDSFMRTARSMMILSLVTAFAAIVLISFETLCCSVCCAATIERLVFLGATACGGLVYLTFASEYCVERDSENILELIKDVISTNDDAEAAFECSFGKGCWYNLIAIVFYFGVSIALCFCPRPTPIIRKFKG